MDRKMFEYVMTSLVRKQCACFYEDYVIYEASLNEDYDWNSLKEWMVKNPRFGMCYGCRSTILNGLYVLLNKCETYDDYMDVSNEMSELWLHPGFGGRTHYAHYTVFDNDSEGSYVEKSILEILQVKTHIEYEIKPRRVDCDFSSLMHKLPIGTDLPEFTREEIFESWYWTDEQKEDEDFHGLLSDMYDMVIKERSEKCLSQ